MSCEITPTAVAARAAPKNGISRTGSKNGFVAGSTPQVSFFGMASATAKRKTAGTSKAKTGRRTRRSDRRRELSKNSAAALAANGGATQKKPEAAKNKQIRNGKLTPQVSFFEVAAPASAKTAGVKQATNAQGTVAPQPATVAPAQRQARLGKEFSPEALSKLSVQLRLGLAAATRHVRALDRGVSRDIGYGDPRPSDWVRLDVRQFEFLTNQLTKARRGDGVIDLSSLKRGELVELWEFLRFEADRALRNIDHLQTPGGPIQGATAGYLAQNHKLEARFYTHLANQIETIFPAENIQAEYPTGTGGS